MAIYYNCFTMGKKTTSKLEMIFMDRSGQTERGKASKCDSNIFVDRTKMIAR